MLTAFTGINATGGEVTSLGIILPASTAIVFYYEPAWLVIVFSRETFRLFHALRFA